MLEEFCNNCLGKIGVILKVTCLDAGVIKVEGTCWAKEFTIQDFNDFTKNSTHSIETLKVADT